MTIKVLVVDDSAFMRVVIRDMLAGDDMEVLTARNGREALTKIAEQKPDAVTLDVEMPEMNGLEVLQRLIGDNKLPVIMLSSHTHKGSRITMDALSLGAADFVAKPELGQDIRSIKEELIGKIRATVNAAHLPSQPPQKNLENNIEKFTDCKLVAMGSSTGGPRAVEKILTGLPAEFPVPIIITQHMPAGFTKAFAQRLNSICKLMVKEAEAGDKLSKGTAYIAPGDYHLVIQPNQQISLNQGPPVEYVRPSVNVMLDSAMDVFGSRIIGVILTGMGKDGAEAMARLKLAGGRTIVQDEATSVIFSMPKAVIDRNAADYIYPLEAIAGVLQKSL